MTTPEKILIQQELAENTYDSHRTIATRLGFGVNVVQLLCEDMNKGKCKHGKKRNPKSGPEPELRGRTRRTVSVAITDDEWKAFRDRNDSPGKRLGDLIRQDINRNT